MPVKLFATYRNCFVFWLLLVFSGTAVHAQIRDSLFPAQPDPPRLVNDLTGTLSTTEAKWLEDKLVDFDKASSNQVSIVIVRTTGNYDIAAYATTLGRRRGIGRQGKNNGVLIVMATESHDINISPGYGLEGVLPDVLCKQIIEHEMLPSFRQGYFYDGLDKATTVIIAVTKGAFTADGPYASKNSGMPRWLIITLLIVGINGFFFIVIPLLRRSFYYLTGKKPPKRKHREWTYSTADVTERKDGPGNNDSSASSSNDFGGYGGGSFGGAGASGKW